MEQNQKLTRRTFIQSETLDAIENTNIEHRLDIALWSWENDLKVNEEQEVVLRTIMSYIDEAFLRIANEIKQSWQTVTDIETVIEQWNDDLEMEEFKQNYPILDGIGDKHLRNKLSAFQDEFNSILEENQQHRAFEESFLDETESFISSVKVMKQNFPSIDLSYFHDNGNVLVYVQTQLFCIYRYTENTKTPVTFVINNAHKSMASDTFLEKLHAYLEHLLNKQK